MNMPNVLSLFNCHRAAVKKLQKISVLYVHAHTMRGTRLVQKARKYRRPEELEDPFYYGVGPKPKVEQVFQSLSARGFGKELPSYKPPSSLEEQMHDLCKRVFGTQLNSDWKSQPLNDRVLKYKLLTKAIELFGKDIPSYELHKMKEVKDVHEYFSTAVEGRSHYDYLTQNRDVLPSNLHVLPETPSFNPATDTFFDGVTAFPGRQRVVYTKEGDKIEKVVEWPHI